MFQLIRAKLDRFQTISAELHMFQPIREEHMQYVLANQSTAPNVSTNQSRASYVSANQSRASYVSPIQLHKINQSEPSFVRVRTLYPEPIRRVGLGLALFSSRWVSNMSRIYLLIPTLRHQSQSDIALPTVPTALGPAVAVAAPDSLSAGPPLLLLFWLSARRSYVASRTPLLLHPLLLVCRYGSGRLTAPTHRFLTPGF